MKLRSKSILSILFVASVLIQAQDHCIEAGDVYVKIHTPWELEGAEERIDALRKGEVTIKLELPDGTPVVEEVPVQIELKKHEFNFGVSMTQSWAIFDKPNFERYRKYMGELFNCVNLGFYWSWIEKKEDKMIENEHTVSNLEWANTRNMTIKGHPLLWHQSIPEWLSEMTDPLEIEQKIQDHIRYLINHYPDIEQWDVYNEAIAAYKSHVPENGVVRWVTYKGGVEPTVASLMSLANEINPDKVYINNHYTHTDPDFKTLNQYLIANNAGFDVIGIQTQMHRESDILSEIQLWDFLEDYAQFGPQSKAGI